MIKMAVCKTAVTAAAIVLLVGCSTIGPPTIPRDRFDYATAIADSWKRVMLLNIVKLRYGDAPVFLEVSSVINQYSLEAEFQAGASWNAFLPGDSQTLGGRGRYADRPTITYNPLTGAKFGKSLLTPIPPAALLSLIQAGWPVDFLLRICVSAINGIRNSSGVQLLARTADPEFDRLLDAMTLIQQAGGLGMRIEEIGDKEVSVLYLRRDLDESLAKAVVTVKRLLGLNLEAHEFRLSYGAIPKDDKEIAIMTRSMIEITAELASRVEVPISHITDNRASPGKFDVADSREETRVRVRIRSSTEKPADAFAAARYRDHWFYVDDRDFQSKRMFSFLMFLFTLAETSVPEKGPMLTIPAG